MLEPTVVDPRGTAIIVGRGKDHVPLPEYFHINKTRSSNRISVINNKYKFLLSGDNWAKDLGFNATRN